MEKLERSLKKRYVLFTVTFVLSFIAILIIVQSSINSQISDTHLINISGRQRMLNQNITKLAFAIGCNQELDKDSNSRNTLNSLLIEWDSIHNYLHLNNKQKEQNSSIDSLLAINKLYQEKIITSSRNIIKNSDSELNSNNINIISAAEAPYIFNADLLVIEYQKVAEENLKKLKSTIYILIGIAVLLLLGELVFAIAPVLKQLFVRSRELREVTEKIAISERKLSANLVELTKLKTDLEAKDELYRIFIEQAPTAIAMFDTNMCYIAVSKRWLKDYKIEGEDIIGRSHYDVFPEIDEGWKEKHKRCLKGAIDTCDEAPFQREDGSIQWIYWDTRPWYTSRSVVGGLIIHTGDITDIKENEEERIHIEKILDKTNEVARIGTWDIDLIKNTIFWSKVVFEIHEVPDDFVPDLEKGVYFYKEGESRNTIENVLNEAMEQGRSFDVKLELVTFKGNSAWVRAIGQAEIVDGKCTRLFGVFQDITDAKKSEIDLSKAYAELKVQQAYNKIFIEQAPTAIAMVDTNMCYLAVSQRWITDYKMEGQEFIGRSHYDLFPEIGEKWKAMHQRCLNGAIDKNDEEPFLRADGSLQWLFWDVRPWYDSEGTIGGIIMQTGDITDIKENEQERIRIEKILDKTNEVARIGTWEVDLLKNNVFWSKMVCEIHEVSEGYVPDLEKSIHFYVEGKSRDTIERVVKEAIEHGTPYDVEVEIETAKGTILWTRAIGQVEFVNGKCARFFGVFQDINNMKLSRLALNKAHNELEAMFNSETVAIVSTGIDGVINQFNRGAEILTGYSASEIVGKQKPKYYHLQKELDVFRIDIAKQYDKDPIGFSAQKELAKHNAYDTREWTYRRKDGSLLPVQLTLTSIKDEQGVVIGYLGVSTDISEKRIAQHELLRKNHLLNFAEEITSMGNWQWDIATNRFKISNNLYKIYQLDQAVEIITFDTYFDFVHPDDKDIVTEYFNRIIEKKSVSKFTHRIILKDGTVKTIQILSETITNEKGEVVKINGASQDVTSAKAAESDLYNAHMQLKAIFNSGPIAIVSTDNNGILNHFNKGAALLLGYTPSEMIGLKEPEIYHLEEELDKFRIDIAEKYGVDPEGFDPYLELAKRNEYDTREWTYRRKDGTTFPVELTITAIKNEQGEKIGFLGVAFDITKRRMARNELLRKNQLLNFAEEITMIGNWKWDIVADKVEWSNNLFNIFEIDKETATLKFDSYFSFVHPEDKALVTEVFDNAINAKGYKSFIHRIVVNGKIKIIQLLGEVFKNEDGKVIEMIGTCQDITEAKAAEIELFDANTQLKAIFNSGPLAIVSVNNDGIINFFNHGAEILLGYSASEMIGIEEPKMYHLEKEMVAFKEDIAKKYNKDLTDFSPYLELAKNNDSDTREWTFRRKDGSTFPVELTLTAIKNKEVEKTGFLAVANDISDRKRAQNELLRKNQILNFAEKITLMGNWQADIINNTVKWSTNLYRVFQLDESTETTLETYLNFTHPEDKERVAEHMRKTIEGKEFTDLSHRIQLADGTVKIVQLLAQVVIDDLGTVTEVIGTCQDVTAQKLAETELLRKNFLLSSAERITMMGNWQWDVVTDTLKWSSNLYKIYEYDESLRNLTYDTFFSQVHPDDKEFIASFVQNSFTEKKFPNNFIHRIVTSSGKIKTVHYLGEVILNEQGEVIEMMGACQDITEQKMEENKFRGLLESAPDAMVIVDENDKIQLINKEAERLFGYYMDELIGERVEMLIPKRFGGMHSEHRENFFGNDPKKRLTSARKELYGLNKNGKEIPIQVSLSPLQTEQGLLLSAAIRDITAQKQAENEILRKNELLIFAEKITMMGNWQWNLINNTAKWSANLYTIFGLDENTPLNYDVYFKYVHEEDKERVSEHIEASLNYKTPVDIMHRIRLLDGAVKTIQLLAEIITDNLGNVIEMSGTCQDVTQQRMAENKFRGLLESAPDAMVIVNEVGKIQLINKQAEIMFGYSFKELLDQQVEILIPNRFIGNHAGYREGFFRHPKVREMGVGKELFGINKEGREIPIQISLSPLETEEGLLVSAAIRDITQQKLAERKIIQAKESLEVLTQHLTGQNKQLEDFAHITSHNLRSPVSNLNALLHLYDISESEEERKVLFEKFEIVIGHLTSTLNTLIEALKTKKGEAKELEVLDFEEILTKTKELISGQIIKTEVIITSNFSLTPKIEYHKTYLESIFLNLVTNAIKYSSPDRSPELHIETEYVDKTIKLTFRDNGLGIDLKRHGHKLFGLNKTFHRHPEAKGVGLYLTKIQIESMGGSIFATSEVNKGSLFTIIFNDKKNE